MRGEEPIAMNTFLKSFNLGRKELNKGDFYKAQETWEHLWKYGTEKERFNIRGMIQLSVGLIKFKMGQFDAGIYLLKKSIKNIQAAEEIHNEIDIRTTVNQIKEILDNQSKDNISSFHVEIKKRGYYE